MIYQVGVTYSYQIMFYICIQFEKIVISFLIHLFLICTLLVGWLFLLTDGILLLFYRRKEKDALLVFHIVSALWAVTTFNALYEGMFLNEKISLIPSLNSWAFTYIIPLFYLYFRYHITGNYPDIKQWIRNLLTPAILLALYGAGSCFATSSDRLIYSWNELSANANSWWILFRICCYILMIVQLAVYLPRLFGPNGVGSCGLRGFRIEQEMFYTLGFCLIAVVAMLTPNSIYDFLYNLSVTSVAVYIFYRSVFYRIIMKKLALPVNQLQGKRGIPALTTVSQLPTQENSGTEKPNEIFTPDEEMQLMKLLEDPRFLSNPNLTLSLLARELSTNETYLSRYFNRQLGLSFPKFITAQRLQEAEQLLENKELTIIEVSEQAGFQTLSAFYQAFNTKHNCSPSQWRKNKYPTDSISF